MPDEPTTVDAYVAAVTADQRPTLVAGALVLEEPLPVPTDVVTRIVRPLAERHASTRPHQPTRP